jgi:hypothetical protein
MWRLLRKTNPSCHRKGDPIFKYFNSLGINKNLVMGPDGPEIKNSCDGEAQQQFTGVY